MAEAVSSKHNEYKRDSATAPWKLVVEPFRLAPRIYYVGNEWVGAFLIDTEDGLILLDTCVFENVYLTLEAIRKLGFDPYDIKHIMLTHCHYDHTGGVRAIHELTGAKIWMSQIDAEFRNQPANMELGKNFQAQPYEVDCFYDDSKPMKFGKVEIRTLLTPGHTPGTTSFFIVSPDENGDMLTAGMHGGVGPPTMTDEYFAKYQLPNLRKQFIEDCQKLKEMTVDIAIPSHPAHGDLFGRKSQDNTDYRPFIDRNEWPKFLDSRVQFIMDLESK